MADTKQIEFGEQRRFVEHYIIVTDEDSRSEFPYTASVFEDAPFEETVTRLERMALRSSDISLLLSGNTGTAEYQGKTGRVSIGEWDGKKWRLVRHESEREIDIEKLLKFE